MKAHHGAVPLSTVMLLALSGGCGGKADHQETGDGGTFVLAASDDPQNLDPHGSLGRYRSNLQMTRLLYDPLVNLSADGRILPGLARRWEAAGGKVTFFLRNDVTCADGTKLTASTVAGNFDYVLDPKNSSSALGTAVPSGLKVSAADTTGQLTVTSSVAPEFLMRQLSGLAIVCPKGLKDRKILVRGSDGTGPYIVSKVVAGTEYRLTRRTGYAWGPGGDPAGRPPKSIVVRVIENETTAANLLLSAGVNAAAVRGTDKERLRSAGLTATSYREPVGQLWFNQRNGHLTGDQKLRTALVQAANLRQVSGVATLNKGVPSQGMLQEPLVCGGVPPASALPAFDRAAAESTLTAAGWKRDGARLVKDGKPLRLTFIYAASLGPPVKSAVELLERTWQDLGAGVTVRALAGPAFSSTLLQTGNWDIEWGVTYPLVPTHLLGYVSGPEPPSGKNFAGIHEAPYQALSADTGANGTNCAAWNAAERSLYTSGSIAPLDDIKVPIFAKGATFAVAGTGGQIVPTTIRMR